MKSAYVVASNKPAEKACTTKDSTNEFVATVSFLHDLHPDPAVELLVRFQGIVVQVPSEGFATASPHLCLMSVKPESCSALKCVMDEVASECGRAGESA
jgi:hypothetical protein